MEATATKTFAIARNARTSLYEVHADGCRHLIARHLEMMTTGNAGETGQEVADEFEARNDGCFATLGPCAR